MSSGVPILGLGKESYTAQEFPGGWSDRLDFEIPVSVSNCRSPGWDMVWVSDARVTEWFCLMKDHKNHSKA